MVYISRVHECINLTVCIGYIAVDPLTRLLLYICILRPSFHNYVQYQIMGLRSNMLYRMHIVYCKIRYAYDVSVLLNWIPRY